VTLHHAGVVTAMGDDVQAHSSADSHRLQSPGAASNIFLKKAGPGFWKRAHSRVKRQGQPSPANSETNKTINLFTQGGTENGDHFLASVPLSADLRVCYEQSLLPNLRNLGLSLLGGVGSLLELLGFAFYSGDSC
jgi:hypothetical protein